MAVHRDHPGEAQTGGAVLGRDVMVKIQEVAAFRTSDGKLFLDDGAAECHESLLEFDTWLTVNNIG